MDSPELRLWRSGSEDRWREVKHDEGVPLHGDHLTVVPVSPAPGPDGNETSGQLLYAMWCGDGITPAWELDRTRYWHSMNPADKRAWEDLAGALAASALLSGPEEQLTPEEARLVYHYFDIDAVPVEDEEIATRMLAKLAPPTAHTAPPHGLASTPEDPE